MGGQRLAFLSGVSGTYHFRPRLKKSGIARDVSRLYVHIALAIDHSVRGELPPGEPGVLLTRRPRDQAKEHP